MSGDYKKYTFGFLVERIELAQYYWNNGGFYKIKALSTYGAKNG